MEAILSAPRFPGLSSAELRLLQSECHGTVYDRGAPGFSQQTRLWNGNLVCSAKAVCCPIDAQDVSRIILFCTKHNLSFSVKAGGYAVAGWAVAGDIVIDLCLIDVIDIEPPLPLSPANNVGSPSSATSSVTAETDPPTPHSSGSKRKEWTPLTDMPSVRPQVKPDKGKGRMAMDMDGFLPNNFPPHMLPRADSSVGVGGKRARSSTPDDASRASFNSFSPDSPFKLPSSFDGSDDNRVPVASLVKRRRAERGAVEAMVYDAASREVASFLRGAPLGADPRYPSRSQPEVSTLPPSSLTNGAEKTALGCGPELADPPSNGEIREERHVSSGSRDPFDYMGNAPSHSAPDGDDTSSHSSPLSARSIPRSEMLSNMTASGTTSNPAPDPFGMLLNGPVGIQPTVLAPPALLSRRPPPLPAGFSASTRAVPVVGTAPVGLANGSEDSTNFSTSFPSMISGVIDYTNGSALDNRNGNGDSSNGNLAQKRNYPLKSGFNGDTTNGAPLPRDPKTGRIPIDPSTLDMLAPSSRKRVEATSTALPDGDINLPDSTTFLRTVLGHGIDAVEGFSYTEDKENGEGDDADPFGYLSMPAGPITPGSPGLHVHGDGVFEQRPTMPMRMSTTTALASEFDNILGPVSNSAPESNGNGLSAGAGTSRSRAPQPGEDMGGVSGGLPPAAVHPHAYVTFGAGMQQREVDLFTTAHPLPARSMHTQAGSPADTTVPYYVPFAAHPVGSSVMMLGGFGFISRLHGLSLDNVVEVEMVLADGRIVIVSETENTDLWFALRGAGPAFGIATRYKARAYPVPVVFAGNLIYRFHRATAPSLLKHYRDCVKGAPRELYANVLLTAGPADQDSLVVVQICYSGPRSKGLEFLHALSSWDGEPCLLNEVGEKSYLAQQDSVAQVLRGQKGRKWFIRSTLISSLPDEVIHNTVTQFANTPIGCTWLFELGGGALVDTEDSCIPPEQREAAFNCAALHQWDIHVDDPRCISSAEKWIHETLSSVSTGAPFTCFLGRHEPYKRVIACFGSNWDRLREIKRKYDPRGLLKHNFWPGHDEVTVETLAEREPASP